MPKGADIEVRVLKQILPIVFLVPLLISSACSSSNPASSSQSGTTVTISGVAQAGPIRGIVTAYAITNDGQRGAALGTTTSDADGNFSLNVPPQNGPVEIAATGAYTDEATGKSVDMGGKEFTQLLSDCSQSQQTPITPLTSMVHDTVLSNLKTGSITSSQIAQAATAAVQEVAQVYGIDSAVIMAVPANPDAAGSNDSNSEKASFVLASLSEAMKNSGLTPDKINPVDAINEINAAFASSGAISRSGVTNSSVASLAANWSSQLQSAFTTVADEGSFSGISKDQFGMPTSTPTNVLGEIAKNSGKDNSGFKNDDNKGNDATICGTNSFGATGIETYSFTAQPYQLAESAVLDSECRLILAGYGNNGGGYLYLEAPRNNVFAVMRVNTNGSQDSTFGNGGVFTGVINSKQWNTLTTVGLNADGKVIAAGAVGDSDNNSDVALLQLSPSGLLDSGFGTSGYQSTNTGQSTIINAMAVQTDGKIVVGGQIYTGGCSNGMGGMLASNNYFLARYNPDGSLDPTFGSGGALNSQVGGRCDNNDEIEALAIDSEGRILATGLTNINGSINLQFTTARYNSNGTLDTSFGTGGIVNTAFAANSSDSARVIVLQPNGKILVAGTHQPPLGYGVGAVTRYNTDGSIDSSFGNGGSALLNIGVSSGVDTMTLQSNGKIILGGSSSATAERVYYETFMVARLASDGSMDPTFGSEGNVTTAIPATFYSNITEVLAQPDGKIVAIGNGQTGATIQSHTYTLAVARYLPNGELDAQ